MQIIFGFSPLGTLLTLRFLHSTRPLFVLKKNTSKSTIFKNWDIKYFFFYASDYNYFFHLWRENGGTRAFPHLSWKKGRPMEVFANCKYIRWYHELDGRNQLILDFKDISGITDPRLVILMNIPRDESSWWNT